MVELRKNLMKAKETHDTTDITDKAYFYLTSAKILHATRYEDVASEKGNGIYIVCDNIEIEGGYPVVDGRTLIVYGTKETDLVVKNNIGMKIDLPVDERGEYLMIKEIYDMLFNNKR
jgi:hypothetical protein